MSGSLLLMNDVLSPDPSFAGMRAFAPVTSVAAGPLILAASATLERAAGITMLEVPYKSQGLEVPDLISGQIAASFAYYPVLAPHLQAGRVRALAVASGRQSPRGVRRRDPQRARAVGPARP